MDAILISLFILSCYAVLKIGLRIYHVRCYLKQRSCRRSSRNQLQAGVVLQVDFSGRYRGMSARAC